MAVIKNIRDFGDDEDNEIPGTGNSIDEKKNRIKEINIFIKELLEERDELEKEIEELNDDLGSDG